MLKHTRFECSFQFLSLGAAGVGKSCLIKRFCEGRFVSRYIQTIGVDYGVKVFSTRFECSFASSPLFWSVFLHLLCPFGVFFKSSPLFWSVFFSQLKVLVRVSLPRLIFLTSVDRTNIAKYETSFTVTLRYSNTTVSFHRFVVV